MIEEEMRRKLAEAYENYSNKYSDSETTGPYGVITFLYAFGLLNDEKCVDFLEEVDND